MLISFFYFLCFLSFGFYCALKARQSNLLPKQFLYIASIAFSLLFTYCIFYLYAYNYRIGHLGVILFLFVSVLFGVLSLLDLRRDKQLVDEAKWFFIAPLVLVIGILVLYSRLFYSCTDKQIIIDQWGAVQNSSFCQTTWSPIDNALPFIYGQNILTNHARSLVIDWSIADRPPLQIGATLPILDFEQQSQQFTKFTSYHLFAIFLQLSWVGLTWGALSTLLKKRSQILALILCLAAVGFFYINSVFVWPKLLAASLVVFGIFLLINTKEKNKNLFEYRYVCMAALAVALGLLAHSSAAFTLLAVALLMLYDFFAHGVYSVNRKHLVVAAATGLALLIPWQIATSQLTHNNRLIKWQLAGVISANDRRGTVETFEQQYSELTFSEWSNSKSANATALLTGVGAYQCEFNLGAALNSCNLGAWRNLTFTSTFFAFEFFIIGLLMVMLQLLRGKLDKVDRTLLIISMLALLLWVLLMFLPASTIVHQGSYATMLLLFILFAKKIASLPKSVFFSIIGLQAFVFYLAWIQAFASR